MADPRHGEGCWNRGMIVESVGRIDRTGPRYSESLSWNTAMNRVNPPSTRSSITASASWSPDCGRASGWLSILTAIALRSRLVSDRRAIRSPATGNPQVGG